MLKTPSPEILQALRAHGPRAITHISPRDLPDSEVLTSELLQPVIDHPAEYPRGWIWAAQEALAGPFVVGASDSSHLYLADVAAAEGWFSTD